MLQADQLDGQTDGPGGPQDRPYQREAVEAITAGLADGGQGQLEAACGTGKTIISIQAAGRLVPTSGLIVMLAPSLALVAQSLRVWRVQDQVGMDAALAVCSDDTVADAPAHLADLVVPVTTSSAAIEEWICGPGRRVLVGTYASAHLVADALRTTGLTADLLICDEAHHLAGRREFATRRVLDRQWLPAQRCLFMTATRRLAGSYGGKIEIVTMDDPAVFGPLLFRYPFADGIADGYLKDYRLLVVGISDSQGRAMLHDQGVKYVERLGAPDLRTVVAQAALGRARQSRGITRAISYHARVEDAAEFALTLPKSVGRLPRSHRPDGDLVAGHVHGEMPHSQRAVVLRALQDPPTGGWAVVANARCLGEGVDLPAVDAVMFAHPKKSAVDIIQAVGRALRRGGDTDTATIIVPVIVPDVDGEIGDLDPGDFKTLWDVVRALRAHDEQLAADLDWHRVNDRIDNPQLPDKIAIEVSEGITDRVVASLSLLLIRQTTSIWLEGYGAACAWHAEHGHLEIPQAYITPSGIRLGGWLSDQRGRHRKGLLTQDKVTALEKLRVVWDAQRRTFPEWLDLATAYQRENGHLNIPTGYTTSDGQRLGTWITNQRAAHRAGTLPAPRVEQLEALGIVWDAQRRTFPEWLDLARAYRREHGHLNISAAYTTNDGHRLGTWLAGQRSALRRGRLSQAHATALLELGVDMQVRYRSPQEWLDLARAYRHEHGHLNVPQQYATPDGDRLGSWLSNQRAAYRKGQLPADRLQELEALGIPWDTSDWAIGLAAARRWHAQHGHLRVPKGTIVDGVNLSNWIQDRRQEQRTGQLDADRARQLEELGIVWQPHANRWKAGYQAAAAWASEYGNLTMPGDAQANGVNLGAWIANQRSAYRRGTLTPDRVAALKALGIVWDPHDQDWRDGLADVTDWVKEHGHARIPGDGRGTRIKALGVWLQRRRAEARAGTLAPDRIAALNVLGVDVADVKTAAHEPFLDATRTFHAEHGHLRVPSTYIAGDGIKLGGWLVTRRQDHRKGKLRPQVAEQLAALDPHWMDTHR